VTGVIIRGEGKLFCGGADIKEFVGDPARLDALRDTLSRIEASGKPVVMALHGMALGGGLELALAGHYRIAAPGTQLALPEVTLGVLPGGGGTQRLPRLIGAQKALAMMLDGKSVKAEAALALGLIDEIATGELTQAALAFLQDRKPAVRRTGELPVPSDVAAAVAAALEKLKPGLNTAPQEILDCVAVVGKGTLSEGLAFEAERFGVLMASEASLGLRHAFFGQRMVAKIPGLAPDIHPALIKQVAVVGGGLMGTGIATAVLNGGLSVVLIEPREDALEKAKQTIAANIEKDVQRGRLSAEAGAGRIAALTAASSLAAAADADLVIEAVFEDMGVKTDVFTALEKIVKPAAILASNTSTLNLDAIAAVLADPSRVVGLHFFSPANIMKLLEVVRGGRTAPAVLATAMAFAKRINKVGVVAGVCDGFIGNRIFEEYLRQAYFLAEDGALPQQVDAAMEAWGMAMGPFRTMDLAGQDIGWSIRKRRAVEQPDRPYSEFLDRVCELGRFGQKTGKGVYLYPDGRTPKVDPEIDALLLAHCEQKGLRRRPVSDAEIVQRCLYAMINEGARIVEEGIAYRPVDIDIIYLNGYGFPAERGGPMFHADRSGLPKVLAGIESLARERQGWVWQPAELLRDLIARGETFESLNQ
jgi:3-hydroxyacyl-CoA dehydrogenase